MNATLHAHDTTDVVRCASPRQTPCVTASSSPDVLCATSDPAAPVSAAAMRAIDPMTHEDIWYALCLMRPCNPMGDYGMGLAILSQIGISEDDARAIMAADRTVA
jgi:hypothetical protein